MWTLLLLSLVPRAIGEFLPNLTGQLAVGIVDLELINNAVVPQRDLMISIYYPTRSNKNPLAPDFPTSVAEYFDVSYSLPNGTLEGVITRSYRDPPIDETNGFPLILFDTGQGAPRSGYTALAEDIASNGYIVVTVDHPTDTAVIEYPNGTVAYYDYTINSTAEEVELTDTRASDLLFVIEKLAEPPTKIPGTYLPLDTSRVGLIGHSIGGAAAAATMLQDQRIVCGIDLDGTISGPVTSEGLDRPFMIMTSAAHNRSNDAALAEFWSNLRGFKRELSVDGTEHLSYSDLVVLAHDFAAYLPPTEITGEIGTILGTRMLEIESVYITSFFGKFLKGEKGELLNRPSPAFPEVHFDD